MWYFVSLSPPANWTLAPLPSVQWKPCVERVHHAAQRAAMRHEDAIQVAELAVPGRVPVAGLNESTMPSDDIEAGLDHAALVGTVPAGNRLARRVDHRHELLHEVEDSCSSASRTNRTGCPTFTRPHQRCAHARRGQWLSSLVPVRSMYTVQPA